LRDWMERTGARSLGDFVPVSTGVGPAEPVPNVGDLSLAAALAAPDTAEARAPMPSIPPQAEEEAGVLDLPSDVPAASSAPASFSGPPETEPPVSAPKRARAVPTTPPAKRKSSSTLLILLVVLG